MKRNMVSPEAEIKEQIRKEYAKTYPNIIFSMANTIERQKIRIDELVIELEMKNAGFSKKV